jgi:hypothetical protein
VIRVAGESACSGSMVEFDPWIPLSITWLPRPLGHLFYLRASGSRGGDVELKVDPETGALVQVVVITAPPALDGIGEIDLPAEPEYLVPVMDGSFEGSVESLTADLGFLRTKDHLRLSFTDRNPSRYLWCGGIRVGVTDDGILIDVVATLQLSANVWSGATFYQTVDGTKALVEDRFRVTYRG